jgi:hypothetical protein
VSQTSGVNRPAQAARRSSRIEETIPITVIGVDSARGPYREQVFTSAISFHGCKYESKFDVLNNSLVLLELGGETPDSPTITARGRVKWAKRPGFTGGPHLTAIELEEPGNIWGLDSPPKDWLEVAERIKSGGDSSKPQPFLVSRAEFASTTLAVAEQASSSLSFAAEVPAHQALAAPARPVGDLMRNFQMEMESFLSEAASAAVRERVTATMEDARVMLREEAKRALAETAAMQATPLIEQSLRQFKHASQETTLAFQVQWSLKLEEDIAKAIGRIEERHGELDAVAEGMAASAIQRLQRALEASRRDGIDRIISGLKEQFTPLVEQAKTATAELSACKLEASRVFQQSLEEFSARTEEICGRLEQKFEAALAERLDAAQQELDRSTMIATGVALDSLRQSSQQYEAEVRTRLQKEVAPVSEEALAAIKQTAGEVRREFAEEMNDRTRRHFEEISMAIADLGKVSKKVAKKDPAS